MASGSDATFLNRLLTVILIPLSLPYSLALRLRAALYRSGVLQTRKLPRPVISVGNITVGGTGKTPATAHIARILISKGLKVAVLSRGYGGTMEGSCAIVSDGKSVFHSADQCGDEPLLLTSLVPGLMVIIGSDRYEAGLLAMRELTPDIFLLDDGFQHQQLHRDLNILLLDSARPFGNGWTLPAGLLREPKSAAQRADLVIQTRSPEKIVTPIIISDKPTCIARHSLTTAHPLKCGPALEFSSIADKRIIAFAGIAEPDVFFDSLENQGLNIISTITFPDHSCYADEQFNTIASAIRAYDADLAITTEKDGVKLSNLPTELKEKILLARLSLTIVNPAPLEEKLLNLLQIQH